ncbi:TPA: hypothetical protein NG563_000410 [Vibrio parahaemolyticus]|nr:hypothetical protein [Vibrio parahaemolyticus]
MINNASHTKSSIYDLNTDKKLRQIHYAKDKAFSFIPIENSWVLGLKKSNEFDLSRLHSSNSELKLSYLGILIHCAKTLSLNTFRSYLQILNLLNYPSNLRELKQLYPQLDNGVKQNVPSVFNKGLELGYADFKPLCEFLSQVKVRKSRSSFLDAEKGAYSDEENQSISYAMRVTTDEFIALFKDRNKTYTPTDLNQLGVLIAHHLMRGILRRPTQITKLKWCDFRPIALPFSEDIESPKLSDIGALHVRIFKGKRGDFRGYAEKRSIRLTPELSNLVGLYHHHYLQSFVNTLANQNIHLNKHELLEIRNKLPFLFDLELFSIEFYNKEALFRSLSNHSQSFHKSENNLNSLLQGFTSRYFVKHLQSNRIDASKLKVTNNRIRHTALTNGARKGMSSPELASMTGVTQKAVACYIDLTNEARSEIDKALADNQILNNFGRISVANLQQTAGFVQLNEFDEEIAAISNPNECNSCNSALGKPLACYPCPNFKPLADANHHYYLDKAERKMKLNKVNAEPITTRRLQMIVSFIRATIFACESFNNKVLKDKK